jgi:hypothetical protein
MCKNVVCIRGITPETWTVVLRDSKTNHRDECAVGLEIVAEEPWIKQRIINPSRHSNPTLEDAAEKLASKMQDKAVSCGFLLTSYGIRYVPALYNQ